MKRYSTFAAAALAGAAITAFAFNSFYMRTLRTTICSQIQTAESNKRYSCTLSLVVLERLEGGETERAKSILAREIASFYSYPWQADAPERQKFVDLVEATKPKSSVLREELAKLAH